MRVFYMRHILHISTGVVVLILLSIHTVIMSIPILLLSLLKIIPIRVWQDNVSKLLVALATFWMRVNNKVSNLLLPTKYVIEGYNEYSYHHSHLIICNHQSWLDIIVLQQVFLTKIPFAKFFMKQQLLFVPIIGLACWALDFPVMKRYSKKYLQKNPYKKGQDLEQTRKICQKFKTRHVSVVNFVEGSRFAKQKHKKQHSPYQYLLKPRAGGVAMALDVLDDKVEGVLDVTICYENDKISFWDFIGGGVNKVHVQIDFIETTEIPYKNYYQDETGKDVFHTWLNERWHKKDQLMETIKRYQSNSDS